MIIMSFKKKAIHELLEENIVAIFEEKTEGRIMGLHLAALSLRHREDLKRVLTGLPDAATGGVQILRVPVNLFTLLKMMDRVFSR